MEDRVILGEARASWAWEDTLKLESTTTRKLGSLPSSASGPVSSVCAVDEKAVAVPNAAALLAAALLLQGIIMRMSPAFTCRPGAWSQEQLSHGHHGVQHCRSAVLWTASPVQGQPRQ